MNEPIEGNPSTADLAYGHERGQHTNDAKPPVSGDRRGMAPETETQPLFVEEDARGYQSRWQEVQTRFVDEPKDSVREADKLVAEVVQKLTTRFAEEKEGLERQWGSGAEVSTEDLRQALQHYRSFFQRLLAA